MGNSACPDHCGSSTHRLPFSLARQDHVDLPTARSNDQMNRPAPSCCLCLCSTSTDNRKRKSLGNEACTEARQVLVTLSGPEPLDIMLKDPFAVLCSGCHRNLGTIARLGGTIARLDKQLADLKANVISCISAQQQCAQSHPVSTIPSRRKRSPAYAPHPQAKQTRIETDSVSTTAPTSHCHSHHVETGTSSSSSTSLSSERTAPEQLQLSVEDTRTQQLQSASEVPESLPMTTGCSQQPESVPATTLQSSPDVKVECIYMYIILYTTELFH